MTYTDLDGITISAYGGEIILSDAKILTKPETSGQIAGDVNQDGRINIFDFIHLKQNLIQTNQKQELQIDNIRCLRKGEWEYDWNAYPESTGAELYTSAEELAERFYDNTIQDRKSVV